MSITAPWYVNARHGVKLVKETSQTSKTAKVISHATEKHHWQLAAAYWTYWTPISMDRFHNLPTKRWSIIQNKMNQEVSHSSRSCCFSHKVCRQKNHSESSLFFRMSLMSQKKTMSEPSPFLHMFTTIAVLEQCGPPCEKNVYNPHELYLDAHLWYTYHKP